MFRDYEYFEGCRKEHFPEIKSIVRVKDVFALDGLTEEMRNLKFPVMAVEYSKDGVLNLDEGFYDRSLHTFHILDRPDGRAPGVDAVESCIENARRIGFKVCRLMSAQSGEPDAPCRGFDRANIVYSKVATAGMYLCGCSFTYTMNRDHETE